MEAKSQLDSQLPAMMKFMDGELNRFVKSCANEARIRTREHPPSPWNPGPFATGATMAALYLVWQGGDDFMARVQDALALGGQDLATHVMGQEELPQVRPHEYAALLAAPLDYNYGVHWGIANRKAQPFMLQGTEDSREAMDHATEEVGRKLQAFVEASHRTR